MISKERELEIMLTISPTIEKQELVLDGTGDNYRPLVLIYDAPECTITESRFYKHEPADRRWRLSNSFTQTTMKS